jgi:hypothetical protein
MAWTVPPLWKDGECWIIGGGKSVPEQFDVPGDVIERVCNGKLFPSAYSEYLSVLHDRHVIGVNNVYQIGVWIDTLFFGDGSWYLVHRQKLAKWLGIKVTCSPKFANKRRGNTEQIKYLEKDKSHKQGISSNLSKVSWNGNSGAAAISLGRHLGVKRILLLGFDMNVQGQYTHWHGNHGRKRKNPPFQRHLKGFPAIAEDAKRMKIEILNVNKNSAISVFPKVMLKEAL